MKKAFKILASSVLAFSLTTGAAYAAEPAAPTQSSNTQTQQAQVDEVAATINLKVGQTYKFNIFTYGTSSNYNVASVGCKKYYTSQMHYCLVTAKAPGETYVKLSIGAINPTFTRTYLIQVTQ
ncbi:hypothetical protein ACVNS2_07930 [Paenibacillus caseinilyticus]|uniref:hypothetical protein n=1 Tax=Paenibacillus mucilaginosus TaxID=61624 RepID=UPI000FFEFB50|nr:hypothetical protein [Paenibacillus mucilaginosus]